MQPVSLGLHNVGISPGRGSEVCSGTYHGALEEDSTSFRLPFKETYSLAV